MQIIGSRKSFASIRCRNVDELQLFGDAWTLGEPAIIGLIRYVEQAFKRYDEGMLPNTRYASTFRNAIQVLTLGDTRPLIRCHFD